MSPAELSARLVDVVRGQLAALEADDFERFNALSDVRDALVAALGRLDGASLSVDDRARLEQVRALAARALEAAARRRQDTATELRSLRRGATALQGYARPGSGAGGGQYSRLDHLR